MSNDTFLLEHGFQLSAALDPHRRAAYVSALKAAFDTFDEPPTVAIIGWQAATLIDVVAGRAKKTTIVEPDSVLLESLRAGIVASGFGDSVTLIREDASTVKLPEKVDIVVFAHNSTWFMEGPSAAILNNARKNVVKSNGLMIPRRFVHLFELACSPSGLNNIALRVPRYGRPGEPHPALAESKHWATSDFTTDHAIPDEVEDTIIVKPLLSGTLTGLRLSTLVELGHNNVHLSSHSGFQSIFIPLREDVNVSAGQPVELFIKYKFGEGLPASRCKARLLASVTPDWDHYEHEITESFRKDVQKLVANLDGAGRGDDLDKVVSYTIDPHGDVSRLTALFWTIDDEFRPMIRELVDKFLGSAAQLGTTPPDDVIYDLMLAEYQKIRAS